MSEQESYDLTELGTHAESLAQLASAVGSTVSTVARTPGPQMYGLLMSPLLTGVMTGITTAAGSYLQGATRAVTETAEGMRRTREAYAQAEKDNAAAARNVAP